jgi:CheY-like chemotaxis protein
VCAKLLCMQLGKLNCSTVRCENGKEAVDLLRCAAPGMYSLVLMDLRMPVMDGFEATAILKNDVKLMCPIVAVSAESGPEVQVFFLFFFALFPR